MNYINIVIIPPVPLSTASIPQPAILEEPPIPVGFKAVSEPPPPQQQYPSISLVLPTNKSESTDNQQPTLGLNNADDSSATLSQQEELSVKGILNSIKKQK